MRFPVVAVSHLHFFTKHLSDTCIKICQHIPCKTHTCWPSFSLLRFTTVTKTHRTYSLQTISITINYDIFFLSCCQHHAVATSTRQIFNCNGNSKVTQNCPFLFAVKLTPLLHYLVATRHGKQIEYRLTQFHLPDQIMFGDSLWRKLWPCAH